MESAIIRKRLNTFKSAKGKLTRVSDDVVIEVLRGWESWPGKAVDYYRDIGITRQQLWVLIKKGKSLVKSGRVTESEFREISLPMVGQDVGLGGIGMELKLDANRAIKFSQVDQLVDFIKKTS